MVKLVECSHLLPAVTLISKHKGYKKVSVFKLFFFSDKGQLSLQTIRMSQLGFYQLNYLLNMC